MPPKAEPPKESNAVRFGRVRNNLKMGVVGLPNVGKSSLFNLLCEMSVSAENFPFCTIDPSESRCPVPDERYDYLCDLWNPPSKYPAYLHVTDIAGLVKGASEGAGLGNNFLSHIQAVDGIFHVVRAFDNDEILHVDDSVDPVRDLETITHELCAKDLEYVLKMVAEELKDVKKSPGMKISALFTATMERVKELLKADTPVRNAQWNNPEVEMIRNKLPNLLTAKPVVYLVNLNQADYIRCDCSADCCIIDGRHHHVMCVVGCAVVTNKKNKYLPKIHAWIQAKGGGEMVPFSVEFEQALWALREGEASPDARAAFLAETGAKSALPRIITVGYSQLNLIYFFTAGEKEVRCWTVQQGALAPQAAGVIHGDFERGFIKAETVAFEDFKALSTGPSMAEVKAGGKYRIEGKGYTVQAYDIMHFQFNVTTAKK